MTSEVLMPKRHLASKIYMNITDNFTTPDCKVRVLRSSTSSHSSASATPSSARGVILVAVVGDAASVVLGETPEQCQAVAGDVAHLEESSAENGVRLFLVLLRQGRGLRPTVVDLVVELEDEHLDEDDEADEGEGAARLGQDALVVAADVDGHRATALVEEAFFWREGSSYTNDTEGCQICQVWLSDSACLQWYDSVAGPKCSRSGRVSALINVR